MFRRYWVFLLLAACDLTSPQSAPAGQPATLPAALWAQPLTTSVTFSNQQSSQIVVYVAFGADSMVRPQDWSFCAASGPLTCSFTLAPNAQRLVPGSKYLNATVAFGAPVGCGVTKAELNLNNPTWFDVVDVSLVDGFSNKVQITANDTLLGPPKGKEGNETVLGLYPYGCDACTERLAPPCGIATGGTGCKTGSQYKPNVPCQYQGPTKGGGGVVVVTLLP